MLTPVIDFDYLEYRLTQDQAPVLILSAATRTQRDAAAHLARTAAGRLLAEVHDPIRPWNMNAPTALERGFSVAVVQVETTEQDEHDLCALVRIIHYRYRGCVVVAPPALVAQSRESWPESVVVCLTDNDDEGPTDYEPS